MLKVLMAPIVVLFFFIMFPLSVNGQSLYYSTPWQIRKTEIPPNNCNENNIAYPSNWSYGGIKDIAFHPNGTLYVINEETLFYYDFDLEEFIMIGDFLIESTSVMTSLAADAQGNLYAASANVIQPNPVNDGYLYQIDINTGEATELGLLPAAAAGDLAFFNGKLYMTGMVLSMAQYSLLVEVDIEEPANSTLLCNLQTSINLNSTMEAFLAYTPSCDEAYLMVSTNNNLHVVDAYDCTATYECFVTGNITGMTMETDFLGSTCCNFDLSAMIDDVSCNSFSDGAILANPAYNYSWNNGMTISILNDLTAGDYNATVSCGLCSTTSTYTVTEPSNIDIEAAVTDEFCDQENGMIEITATGGSGSYSYAWNNISGDVEDPEMLSAGNYSLTVTDSNNCSDVANDLIINNEIGFTASIAVDHLSCYQDNSGSLEVVVASGTTLGYTYQWNPEISNANNAVDLPAGEYNVTITSNNECTVVLDATIEEPSELILFVENTTEASCSGYNGSVLVTVIGGMAPYSFNWTGTSDDTNNPTNLSAGAYTVTVTDENDCSASISATVTTSSQLTAEVIDFENVSCYDGSDGVITINVQGGTPPFEYIWSNQSLTQNITDLSAGNYSVTVTDISGCSFVLAQMVTEPIEIIVSGISTDASCDASTGMIEVTVFGGSAPYQYEWLPDLGNTESLTNLAPGNYALTVTDNTGCTGFFETSVSAPNAFSLSSEIEHVDCYGESTGSINIILNGGVAPLSYNWNTGDTGFLLEGLPAGIYTATVTDNTGCSVLTSATVNQSDSIVLATAINQIGCNNLGSIMINPIGGTSPYSYQWSNTATTQNLEELPAGLYVLTVTDANNCASFFETSLSPYVSDSITIVINDVNCFGLDDGAIDVTVNSDYEPLQFQWNTGLDTEDAHSLSIGTYTLTITNSLGCENVTTAVVDGPDILSVTALNPTNISCNGISDGAITITVSGGLLPYAYSWNTGAATPDLLNVSAGIYEVTVADYNNCTTTASVSLTEPVEKVVNCEQENAVSTPNGTDGEAIITVAGGSLPFEITWSGPQNGTLNQSTFGESIISDLIVGTYQIVVTDANDCTASCEFIIDDFECDLEVVTTVSNIDCDTENTGEIALSIQGGVPPFNVDWSQSQFDGMWLLTDLGEGTYSAMVTDSLGCFATSISNLVAPDPININYQTACIDKEMGSLSITSITGGAGNYEYALGNEMYELIQDFPVLIPALEGGTHEILIRYNDLCEQKLEVNIISGEDLFVQLGQDENIKLGESTMLEPILNFNPVEFQWSPVDYIVDPMMLSPTINPVSNVTYVLTAKNESGCQVSDTINITVENERKVFIPNAFSPNGDGVNDYFTIYGGKEVLEIVDLLVFDRWGGLVYEQHGLVPNIPTQGWGGIFKGEKMQQGVYTCVIKVLFSNKETSIYKSDLSIIK